MVFWERYVSDESMGTFAPILVYWIYGGFYQLLPPLDKYRLHTRKEEDEKNSVSLSTVIKGVLLQQLVQATVAQLLFMLTSQTNASGIMVQPPLVVQVLQFIVAMLVMDTWQYFVHRYMHQNKFLYLHVHSQHHRLVVPYAIGALYNHPLEGLLLDTVGGALSFLVSGMTARTAVFFSALLSSKLLMITVVCGSLVIFFICSSKTILHTMTSIINSKEQNSTIHSLFSLFGINFLVPTSPTLLKRDLKVVMRQG